GRANRCCGRGRPWGLSAACRAGWAACRSPPAGHLLSAPRHAPTRGSARPPQARWPQRLPMGIGAAWPESKRRGGAPQEPEGHRPVRRGPGECPASALARFEAALGLAADVDAALAAHEAIVAIAAA